MLYRIQLSNITHISIFMSFISLIYLFTYLLTDLLIIDLLIGLWMYLFINSFIHPFRCTCIRCTHISYISQMFATYWISRITCGLKYGFLPSAGECLFVQHSTCIVLLTVLRTLSDHLFHFSTLFLVLFSSKSIGEISFIFSSLL
jgi:hypothetical protein